MDDLISREALYKTLCRDPKYGLQVMHGPNGPEVTFFGDAGNDFAGMIVKAPAVDAVVVVRCKDCLYCKHNVCIRKAKHGGSHSVDKVHANFFCAAGKRRTDHDPG